MLEAAESLAAAVQLRELARQFEQLSRQLELLVVPQVDNSEWSGAAAQRAREALGAIDYHRERTAHWLARAAATLERQSWAS